MRKLFVLLTLVLIAGCTTSREDLVEQGFPPTYIDGFADGCRSGEKAAGNIFEKFTKDLGRFSNEPEYAQGWPDGFQQCKNEYEYLYGS